MSQTPFVPPLGPGPSRLNAFTVDNPRLNRVIITDPGKCATLSEYARAAAVDTAVVMQELSRGVEAGVLTFESVGTELFVRTAPGGRPIPAGLPEIQPNLWERLRQNHSKHEAYPLWQTVRGLEGAGWVVEANPSRITFSLSPVNPAPSLGLVIGDQTFPAVIRPTNDDLGSPAGPFALLSHAGARLVVVIVDSGALDAATTAIRRLWMAGFATSSVALILEGPRFNPVQISANDASVAPRSVNISSDPAPPAG